MALNYNFGNLYAAMQRSSKEQSNNLGKAIDALANKFNKSDVAEPEPVVTDADAVAGQGTGDMYSAEDLSNITNPVSQQVFNPNYKPGEMGQEAMAERVGQLITPELPVATAVELEEPGAPLIQEYEDLSDEAKLWAHLYQGEGYQDEVGFGKATLFDKHVGEFSGLDTEEANAIRDAVQEIGGVFAGDEGGTVEGGVDPAILSDLLWKTALHESHGGKYDRQMVKMLGIPVPMGKGRGPFQMELATARDMLNPGRNYFGDKANKIASEILGKDVSLSGGRGQSLSDSDLKKLVHDPRGGALFAGNKWIAAAKHKGKLDQLSAGGYLTGKEYVAPQFPYTPEWWEQAPPE
tara:strand:+ start:1225 stop:2274 length:1050 start_codon:yes stop_codon:yes gene_type:complete